MLREADVEIGKGTSVQEVCRKLGIHGKPCYRQRREYRGLKLDQAKQLKELALENRSCPRRPRKFTSPADPFNMTIHCVILSLKL
ncbi:transposase [bacterium]|nr:transposase [bacterium]MBU1638015.1 transposase [bacterium]MBU1920538.1 transposase [bacterium]